MKKETYDIVSSTALIRVCTGCASTQHNWYASGRDRLQQHAGFQNRTRTLNTRVGELKDLNEYKTLNLKITTFGLICSSQKYNLNPGIRERTHPAMGLLTDRKRQVALGKTILQNQVNPTSPSPNPHPFLPL